MSNTKDNFENMFHEQMVGDADFKELRDLQNLQQEWESGLFRKLPDCLKHLNTIKGVRINIGDIDWPGSAKEIRRCLKGKYTGMIYTEENQTLKTLKSIIESYGFTIVSTFFLEEIDDKFTHISFTIKE